MGYFPGLGGGLDIFSGLNPNKEPESPYTPQATKNCRMVKVTELEGKVIDDFKKCSEIQGLSYNWLKKEMLNQGGMCRWAGGRESSVEEEGRGVCLCPATTEKLCTKGRASCYFPAPINPTYGSTVQGSGEQQQVYGQQPQYPPTFGQQPVQQAASEPPATPAAA